MKRFVLILFLISSMLMANEKIYSRKDVYVKSYKIYSIEKDAPITGILVMEKDGKRKETRYERGMPSGMEKTFYPSGKVFSSIPYKRGKKSGIAKTYYENGQLWFDSVYVDGMKVGTERVFYEDGNLKGKVEYKSDKAISGVIFDKDGNKIRNMTRADFKNLKYRVIENPSMN